jgi:hypothetical protein
VSAAWRFRSYSHSLARRRPKCLADDAQPCSRAPISPPLTSTPDFGAMTGTGGSPERRSRRSGLLQSDSVFRLGTHEKIRALAGNDDFNFFAVSSLTTPDFEVIFVIVAARRGRTVAEALPFFSNVNLERTAGELLNRGFRIAVAQVDCACA